MDKGEDIKTDREVQWCSVARVVLQDIKTFSLRKVVVYRI